MNCLLACALGLIMFMAASLTYPQPERRSVTTETLTQQQLKSKMSIPDVEVLDQDGKKIRFYTDLVKGNSQIISQAANGKLQSRPKESH